MHVCVCLCSVFSFFLSCSARAVFYPFFVFQVNHLSSLLFLHSTALSFFTPHSCRNCNHVRGLCWGKEGEYGGRKEEAGVGEFEANVGKRKKKAFVCVPNYHSSQPKVTFAENGRTRSQNSYFYPASSVCVYVCWLQWWWGTLNNIMAFLSSVSSGLIICVPSLCVIVTVCEWMWLSECVCVCPVSDCTSWLSPSPADFNPGPQPLIRCCDVWKKRKL